MAQRIVYDFAAQAVFTVRLSVCLIALNVSQMFEAYLDIIDVSTNESNW